MSKYQTSGKTTKRFSKLVQIIENSEKNIKVIELKPSYCVISFNLENEGTEGKCFTDGEPTLNISSKRIIVSDGTHILEYELSSKQELSNECLYFSRRTKTFAFDVDEDGHKLNLDGRNRLHITCDTGTVDSTNIYYNYQVQALLWHQEDRDQLKTLIDMGLGDKVCVNHKNNYTFDCRERNLEVVTKTMNSMHSVFVEMVWAGDEELNPLAKYRGKTYNLPNEMGSTNTKHALNFCLSARDLIDFNTGAAIDLKAIAEIYKRSEK